MCIIQYVCTKRLSSKHTTRYTMGIFWNGLCSINLEKLKIELHNEDRKCEWLDTAKSKQKFIIKEESLINSCEYWLLIHCKIQFARCSGETTLFASLASVLTSPIHRIFRWSCVLFISINALWFTWVYMCLLRTLHGHIFIQRQ